MQPGAFSAYRYEALLGEPLETYFSRSDGMDIWKANMYLAEDRILCFELVVNDGRRNILRYVKSARAETDVPKTLIDLINQRRRWLNGSFFASMYAIRNWKRINMSAHGGYQKILFHLQFMYNLVNLLFAWFNLANFFITFYFLFDIVNTSAQLQASTAGATLESPSDPFYPHGVGVVEVVSSVYVTALITIFVASLGNTPQHGQALYITSSIFFGLVMAMMFFMGLWSTVYAIRLYNSNHVHGLTGFFDYATHNQSFRDIVISNLATYGLYFLSPLIHLDPWHVLVPIFGLIQYILMIPTYINVIMVYSFCNSNDISWGKRDPPPAQVHAHSPAQNHANPGQMIEVDGLPHDAGARWNEIWGRFSDARSRNEFSPPEPRAAALTGEAKQKALFANYRTWVLLGWILSNAGLSYIFTNQHTVSTLFPKTAMNPTIHPYLTFLFWAVAILSFVRFFFSTVYMAMWTYHKLRT